MKTRKRKTFCDKLTKAYQWCRKEQINNYKDSNKGKDYIVKGISYREARNLKNNIKVYYNEFSTENLAVTDDGERYTIRISLCEKLKDCAL